MKKVKILCSIFTAIISLLTIFQHIVLVLPDNPNEWNTFERILYYVLKSRYWIWVLMLLIVLLVVLTIMDVVLAESRHHHFKVQTPRFKKFFTKWYSQHGKLIVICDDIDWTCDKNDCSIFRVLEKKCAEGLTLYLGSGFKSERAKKLQDKGAKVIRAKPSLIRNYSFSCIAPMDRYSNIIVRDKEKDVRQEVEFSELSDERVIALLTALLEDI